MINNNEKKNKIKFENVRVDNIWLQSYYPNELSGGTINTKKKILRSRDGDRCLTKCYKKGSIYVHPVALRKMLVVADSQCAINPVTLERSALENLGIGPQNINKYSAYCNIEDNETHSIPNEIESMLASFYFSPIDFLSSIYNIKTFDDCIDWSTLNNKFPKRTIKRVHDCSWIIFGLKDDEISDKVSEYYLDMFKKQWSKFAIRKLLKNNNFMEKYNADLLDKNYIKNNTTDTGSDIDTDTDTDSFNTMIQQIINKFYDNIYIKKQLLMYIDITRDNWYAIESHYDDIKNYILENFLKIIYEKNFI
jgi:hypothetical protein